MELLFIALIIASETAGQGFLKEYATDAHPQFLALGVVCYFVVVMLLSRALQYDGMGAVNLIWSVMSIVAVFIVGMLFFHEHVTTLQITGISLSLMGIAILHFA